MIAYKYKLEGLILFLIFIGVIVLLATIFISREYPYTTIEEARLQPYSGDIADLSFCNTEFYDGISLKGRNFIGLKNIDECSIIRTECLQKSINENCEWKVETQVKGNNKGLYKTEYIGTCICS